MVRLTKTYIGGTDDGTKMRKIEVVMISHKYDDHCLYLTVPEIYDTPELTSSFRFLLDQIKIVL